MVISLYLNGKFPLTPIFCRRDGSPDEQTESHRPRNLSELAGPLAVTAGSLLPFGGRRRLDRGAWDDGELNSRVRTLLLNAKDRASGTARDLTRLTAFGTSF